MRIRFGEDGQFVGRDAADCGEGVEHDGQVGGVIGSRVGGGGRVGKAGTGNASERKEIRAVGLNQETVDRGCGGGGTDAGCGGVAERPGERDETTEGEPVAQNVARAAETVSHERGNAAREGFNRRQQRAPYARAVQHDRPAAAGGPIQLTSQHLTLDIG